MQKPHIERTTGQDLWIKLARACNVFSKLALRHIQKLGLTPPQFGVLETLHHLGPMTIGSLCQKQLVSGGNMTVVLDNLVRDGHVERVPSEKDRRVIEVRLTEKGSALIAEIFPEHSAEIDRLASVLTPDEQVELSTLLKKLGTSLQQQEM